jgi:hypothetical protein
MITAEKGDHWKLSALYGQDSESWMINEFDANQTQKEFYQVTIGNMLLSGEYNQNAKTKVTFCWNMDENHCNFQGLSSFNDAFFVNEEARSNYKEQQEDCDGLWED